MKNARLKVYYDGLCVVCDKEMDLYKKRDRDNRVDFVDISSPEFDANAEGLDPQKVKAVFHVRNTAGQLQVGVDGFVAIWETLEIFSPLAWAAQSFFFRPFFDLGYFAFSKARPFLPRKQCANGHCAL